MIVDLGFRQMCRCGLVAFVFGTVIIANRAAMSGDPTSDAACRVLVLDRENHWPVPMVELRTTHQVRWYTDNTGMATLDLPELMGRETWLFVEGRGYTVPADGFGYRGVRVTPEPNQVIKILVERTSIAKRLGRLTGAGLQDERAEANGEGRPRSRSLIMGCDSVQLARHRGRLFWFWGDTTLAHYPLGIFHMTGATTELVPLLEWKPPVEMPYQHFTDASGRPRAVAEMPGEGPTWLTNVVSLPDADSKEHLVATYRKIRGFLQAYEVGLCEWDDQKQVFQHVRTLWSEGDERQWLSALQEGHPVFWTDERQRRWVLFGNPFPHVRFPATYEAWRDVEAWETLPVQQTVVVRATSSDDVDITPEIRPHSGSIAWHAGTNRWISVFVQRDGSPSALGEVWYAEATQPTGPWRHAVKILSHPNNSFYNPRLHPEMDGPDADRAVLFEGTLSQQFADQPVIIPRYDYNQLLYRLDLDDLPPLTDAR